ncbi:MAG: efflux RND transporter periplasmic adaptor subunit [Gemmatimonadota bacterium]|nr:efflux RND transporter periplasmic adaptor subunit [Gemmatimonadota bacterium]MDH5758518.1 efflux RND transporter periplasmic adaptor subunit [Gemmatimonadota bacterium]
MTSRALAALVATLVAWGCTTGEAAEETPRVQTAEVTRGDLTITAEATGTIEPVRSVEVKSKASGEILRLHADVGDVVAPGALLATVDPRDVRNQFEQAVADLEVARARVEIADAQLDRSEELLAAGVVTQQEHESRRLESANAQATLVKAETNHELSQLRLSDVTIRAPLAGTILSKSVEEGQVIQSASGNVSGGTTLFVMANLDQMRVRTLVDETDMGDITAGLTATVRVEAFPDRMFRGVVEKIEPQAVVQQNVTMFPVIVSLENRTGLLKPGMNAEVEVLIDQASDVVLVPNNAVVQATDVGPAALALGLDPEALDLQALVRSARGGRGPGGPGGQAGQSAARGAQGAPQGAPREAGSSPAGPAGAGAADPRARMDSLRARVERGEITQDSMRALMARFREQAGGGAFPGGRPGGRPGAAGGGAAAEGVAARDTRAAVVFVLGPDSIPVPRVVRIGLNDWDHTQVVEGLEEGETLAVVGAAQLQARQQEWLNVMRSRMGGGPFGGGGPGGGPRGGGPR